MLGKRAVLTLLPVSPQDTVPFRSLTFTSDSDKFPVGRSSKYESKNLIPAVNNAWFDARVMSRNHAFLGVSSQTESIYVHDNGSMHGTFINDKKVPIEQSVPIQTGDVLMFGSEVTRGSETFPPLRVRCECQWLGISPASESTGATRSLSTNSFVVPDDEDDDNDGNDDVEITPDSISPNHPVDNLTPITPPMNPETAPSDDENKQLPLRRQSDAARADIKEPSDSPQFCQQNPVLVEGGQGRVTGSNPPGAYPDAQNQGCTKTTGAEPDSQPIRVSVGKDDSSDLGSDNWNAHEDSLSLQDDSESCLSGDLGDEDLASNAPSEASSQRSESPYRVLSSVAEDDSESTSMRHDAWDASHSHFDNGESESPIKRAVHTSRSPPGARIPAPPPPAFRTVIPPKNTSPLNPHLTEMGYESIQCQTHWTVESSPARVPSPSDKAMAKTSNPNLSYSYGTFPPSFEDWHVPQASTQASQVPFASYTPAPLSLKWHGSYAPQAVGFGLSRGPLRNFDYSNSPPLTHPPVSEDRQSDYRAKPGSNRCSDFSLVSPAGFPTSSHPSVNVSDPSKLVVNLGSNRDVPNLGHPTTTTRVSIADIVDESVSVEARPSQYQNPLKRKAAEMEPGAPLLETDDIGSLQSFPETPISSGRCHMECARDDITASFPNAQPQPALTMSITPCNSQQAEISRTGTEHIRSGMSEVPRAEPQPKRVKATNRNRGGTLIRYAATALMGAVVGGVGAIAALASLPPDFFTAGAA